MVPKFSALFRLFAYSNDACLYQAYLHARIQKVLSEGGGGGGVQHSDEIFLSVLAGERREDLIPHHRPASEMQ